MMRSGLEQHVADVIDEVFVEHDNAELTVGQHCARAAIAAVFERLPEMVTDEMISAATEAWLNSNSELYPPSSFTVYDMLRAALQVCAKRGNDV